MVGTYKLVEEGSTGTLHTFSGFVRQVSTFQSENQLHSPQTALPSIIFALVPILDLDIIRQYACLDGIMSMRLPF